MRFRAIKNFLGTTGKSLGRLNHLTEFIFLFGAGVLSCVLLIIPEMPVKAEAGQSQEPETPSGLSWHQEPKFLSHHQLPPMVCICWKLDWKQS